MDSVKKWFAPLTIQIIIPGGCTSRLQPADVSWNRPFKAKLAELYDEWLFNGPVDNTKNGNSKAPSKPLLLKWIKEAWLAITPETIRKSLKKCGIANAMDGTEDDLFKIDSSDSEDNNFEGFSPEEVQIGEEAWENLCENIPATVESRSDKKSTDDNASDYDSPGH